MKPLSNNCRQMLMQAQITGTCLRFVKAPRERKWQIAGQFFHEFTGDALVNRGLLEPVIYQHDGNSFDRFNPIPTSDQTAPK